MTSTMKAPSTPGLLKRSVVYGAGAGVVASLVMAMYAMAASWEKDTGFFTPLYHIASLWTKQDAMMTSMQDAMAGDHFYFTLGPAIAGAMIHMMTGAMYGAAFGFIASRLPIKLWTVAAAGLVWGFLVFAMSAYIGLPLAGGLFNSGDQIKNMAEMAGWGTFIIEHLLYGLVLGLLVGLARRGSQHDRSGTRHA